MPPETEISITLTFAEWVEVMVAVSGAAHASSADKVVELLRESHCTISQTLLKAHTAYAKERNAADAGQ
jgi:hypothetical protein